MKFAAAAVFDLISRCRAKLDGAPIADFPDGRPFIPIVITHFDPSRPNDLPPSMFELEASKLEAIKAPTSMHATNARCIRGAYNLREKRLAERVLFSDAK